MAWVFLAIASLGEIFGVACINLYLKERKWYWMLLLIISFLFGFIFLAFAMEEIPLSTAYAVWTGLGATGAVLMGILFFKETVSLRRMLFLTCIISGAVGLRIFG